MTIDYQISILIAFFWLLPAIRQRKSEYFLLFIVLAIGSPLNLGLTYLHRTAMESFFMISFSQSNPMLFYLTTWFSSNSLYTYLLVSLLAFFAVHKLEYVYSNPVLNTFAICFFVIGMLNINLNSYFNISLQILLTFKLLYRTIIFSRYLNRISVFDFIIVFYFIAVILIFILTLAGNQFIYAYNTGAEAFRVLMAFYFTIIKYDSKYAFISLPDYSAGRT